MAQINDYPPDPDFAPSLWDWHVNITEARRILNDFRDEAQMYFDAVRRTFPDQWVDPPNYTPPGTTTAMSALDATNIQLYNGASITRRLLAPSGTFYSTYRSRWRFRNDYPPEDRWEFVPNRNDYVRTVVDTQP